MQIELKLLLSEIGAAVSYAHKTMEESAAQQYFRGFEAEDDGGYTACTRKIKLPGVERNESQRVIDLPLTTLVPHSVMELEQVEINLKAVLQVEEGEILIEPKGLENEGTFQADALSSIKLIFQNKVSSEGVARVEQKMVNLL